MFNIKGLYDVLDGVAPIKISETAISKGEYDNSGIIVNDHKEVNKILFSLDLSLKSVKRAKALGCDTVVTHHPAIYYPIKKLDNNGDTADVLNAVKNGLNVICFHLNLDMASGGIDDCLKEALGGKKYRIIDTLFDNVGYGREFGFNGTFGDLIKTLKSNLKTDKFVAYGKKTDKITSVASFCGAGSGQALDYLNKDMFRADVIVSSDVKHHELKYFLDKNKKVIILSHYCAEEYGFKKFYERVSEIVKDKVKTEYFDDKRFR